MVEEDWEVALGEVGVEGSVEVWGVVAVLAEEDDLEAASAVLLHLEESAEEVKDEAWEEVLVVWAAWEEAAVL